VDVYVINFNIWHRSTWLSLYVSTIMINAQASSGSASGGGSDSDTGVKQMGICVVDVESPCNGVK
jgi:hypothetical protein